LSTNANQQIKHLGIDAGGTFTDFVVVHESGFTETHKVLSTPSNPANAIIQGIRELGLYDQLDKHTLKIVHGSTVATNAALEGKVAKTAFVTNEGFADMLTIGRQNRKELYNLKPIAPTPPVPKELCFEVPCRRTAQGEVLKPLSNEAIDALVHQLKNTDAEAVAINLLFSFLDDEEEKRIEQALKGSYFTSRSSFVLPVYKEYERGMATWLNASLGPKVNAYLTTLQDQLKGCDASIMQSSGGLMSLDEAAHRAVNLLLSGPAGGLSAIRVLSKSTNTPKILSFDMGGTSTDVSLMDGDFHLTDESRIADWPIAVPMLDMATIGAGGGSIAWIDEAGMLHVGPESAGSDPGPACYGQGGQRATVTDANLILGHLPSNAKLGGSLALDIPAAERAIDRLASQLGLTRIEAAQGIVQLAEQQMVGALHNISVKQGHSPSDFVLCCFGGAGGMHVCSLAEQLDMRKAIIPRNSGVLSAYGMLTAPPMRTGTRSHIKPLNDVSTNELNDLFENMLSDIALESPELVTHGTVDKQLDLRYLGQSFTIEVPYTADCEQLFEAAHERRYGHRLNKPIELVNLKLSVRGTASINHLSPLDTREAGNEAALLDSSISDSSITPDMFDRDTLTAGKTLHGPAIITEKTSTTWLAKGWACTVDAFGNLLLERVES